MNSGGRTGGLRFDPQKAGVNARVSGGEGLICYGYVPVEEQLADHSHLPACLPPVSSSVAVRFCSGDTVGVQVQGWKGSRR